MPICKGVLIFFPLGYKFTLVIQPIYKPQLQQPERETGYGPFGKMVIIFPRRQEKTPFICSLFRMLFSSACHSGMDLTVAKKLQKQRSHNQKSSVSSQNKFAPGQPRDLPSDLTRVLLEQPHFGVPERIHMLSPSFYACWNAESFFLLNQRLKNKPKNPNACNRECNVQIWDKISHKYFTSTMIFHYTM